MHFSPTCDFLMILPKRCLTIFGSLIILNILMIHDGWNNPINAVEYVGTMNDAETCKPTINVAFLKVHKCASSSISNILMRFGDSRNLNFVLPKSSNVFGHPSKKFNTEFVFHYSLSKGYNILCHHTRWSNRIKEIMPESTEYIGILREPTKMFESLYQYMYFEREENFNISFDDFLENPENVFRSSITPPAWNPMMFDFGLEIKDFRNRSKIREKILEIDQIFDLILIADYFLESLILLKDKLCWDWQDVVSFQLNQRNEQQRRVVTKEKKQKIRNWNQADVLLYDYFHEKFQQRLNAYGRVKMARDVEILQKINKDRFAECASKNIMIWNASKGDAVLAEMIDPVKRLCETLSAYDESYTEFLRKKQKHKTTKLRLH